MKKKTPLYIIAYLLISSVINNPSLTVYAKNIAPHSVIFLQYHRVGEEHIRKRSSGRIWTNIQEFQFINHLDYLSQKEINVDVFKRDTYCNSIESAYLNSKNTEAQKSKNINYRKNKRAVYLAKKEKQGKKPGSAWRDCVITTDTQSYKKANFEFSIIPMQKAVSHLVNQENFNSNSVVITVDDPYRSFYTYGFKHLTERNLPFTFFINTDIVDKNNHKSINGKKLGILTWDELREITKYKGTNIGCHTANHGHMIEQSEEQNILSIIKCITRIKEELGVSPHTFAYPYGESTEHLRNMLAKISPKYIKVMSNKYPKLNDFVQQTISKHSGNFFNDFKIDVAFGQHSSPASFIPKSANLIDKSLKSSSSDLYNLPRFALNEKYGAMNSFKDKVSSLGMPIVNVKFNNLQENNLFLTKTEEKSLTEVQFSVLRNIIKYSYLNACYVWNKPVRLNKKGLHSLTSTKTENQISFNIAINKIYDRSRRERINCTFAKQGGRFYWFGLQFTKYYRKENNQHKPAPLPLYLTTASPVKRGIASNTEKTKSIKSLKLKDWFHIQYPLK